MAGTRKCARNLAKGASVRKALFALIAGLLFIQIGIPEAAAAQSQATRVEAGKKAAATRKRNASRAA